MRRPQVSALLGLVALGAVVRFSILDLQSLWFDEAKTAALTRMSLGGMLDSGIPGSESTPPLYFLLAWAWAKAFGTGEVGLRSLSALLGTAAVPVAFAAATTLVSRRVGLVAAALVAVNPLLVWYSQEARAYSLLVLLGGLSFLLFVRARAEHRSRDLWLWALCSSLAIATHYFAAFLVVPEGLWLLLGAPRRRALVLPLALVMAVGAGLLPLALHQRASGRSEDIGATSLWSRVHVIPQRFVLGEQGSPVGDYRQVHDVLPVGVVLVLLGLGLLARTEPRERRGALVAAAIGGASTAGPLLFALGGLDYVNDRNVLGAALPLGVVLATGFGARRAGRLGLAAAGGLCVFSLAVVAMVQATPELRRDDWRELARALGPPQGPRAIVSTPFYSDAPLEQYVPRVRPMPEAGAPVREVAVVGMRATGDAPAPQPGPAFQPVERRSAPSFTLIRFRAPRPTPLSAGALQRSRLPTQGGGAGPALLLIQEPGG